MTVGIAIAGWNDSKPIVCVAADSRISLADSLHSDNGLKTYELSTRCGAVAAGNVIPVATAVEATRTIIETHNSANSKPLGFYDTVRVFGFFLHRSMQYASWSAQVVVAGMASSNAPTLAYLTASRASASATFKSAGTDAFLAWPVGVPQAAALLSEGVKRRKREGRPLLPSAIELIYYMGKNESSDYQSIGGAVSAGGLMGGFQRFAWPHIEIEGRRFFRGLDVSASMRPSWAPAQRIDYDESWCAQLDAELSLQAALPPTSQSAPEAPKGHSIDLLRLPESELFATHDDLDTF